AVVHERRRLLARAQSRRSALGRNVRLDGPEPVLALEEAEDADPRDIRRARLPRALQQRARVLDGPAAPAGREPAGAVSGRESLDPEGREQPVLLPGSAR